MDYYKACKILDLNTAFKSNELRHNYYTFALKYHPDRNSSSEATGDFQEILEAYTYLKKYSDLTNPDIDNLDKDNHNSYTDLLEQFMTGIIGKNFDTAKFLPILQNECSKISLEILKQLPKTTTIQLQKFTQQYADILNINSEIVDALNTIVCDNSKDDSIIVLKPTLENLLNDEIYKVNFQNETYCIPLWHHELIYELSNNYLVIECEPILPNYISLDNYNNLYINISTSVSTLINQTNIDINIGNNKYIVPVKDLYLRKFQRYCINALGISLINTKDIFNVDTRANIFVDIRFIDIE
jgi:hypothetical protein